MSEAACCREKTVQMGEPAESKSLSPSPITLPGSLMDANPRLSRHSPSHTTAPEGQSQDLYVLCGALGKLETRTDDDSVRSSSAILSDRFGDALGYV